MTWLPLDSQEVFPLVRNGQLDLSSYLPLPSSILVQTWRAGPPYGPLVVSPYRFLKLFKLSDQLLQQLWRFEQSQMPKTEPPIPLLCSGKQPYFLLWQHNLH